MDLGMGMTWVNQAPVPKGHRCRKRNLPAVVAALLGASSLALLAQGGAHPLPSVPLLTAHPAVPAQPAMQEMPTMPSVPGAPAAPALTPPAGHNHHHNNSHNGHNGHNHDVGPAGRSYDLRWLDAMVQHHTGALRMSEYVFDIGVPGVGSLAKEIWRDQAQEIKAMGQWRKAWFPEAPPYPVALAPGGDPDTMAGLIRMNGAQIAAMRMMESTPNRDNRVPWFLEGMLQHHGGALQMAHDALAKSRNPDLRRLAAAIIVAQRREIIQLRRMLNHDGLTKPDYYRYDALFSPN
jgi:uncharacterized protein (DUF305 family)